MKWRDLIVYILIIAGSAFAYSIWHGEAPTEDIWTQILVLAIGTVILGAVREEKK